MLLSFWALRWHASGGKLHWRGEGAGSHRLFWGALKCFKDCAHGSRDASGMRFCSARVDLPLITAVADITRRYRTICVCGRRGSGRITPCLFFMVASAASCDIHVLTLSVAGVLLQCGLIPPNPSQRGTFAWDCAEISRVCLRERVK